MKKLSLLLVLILAILSASAQMKPEETEDWSRKPPEVTPGKFNQPPSDAIILYRTPQDLVNWVHEKGDPVKWQADSALTVVAKTGGIKSVRSFGDCQLHIEWRSPEIGRAHV